MIRKIWTKDNALQFSKNDSYTYDHIHTFSAKMAHISSGILPQIDILSLKSTFLIKLYLWHVF